MSATPGKNFDNASTVPCATRAHRAGGKLAAERGGSTACPSAIKPDSYHERYTRPSAYRLTSPNGPVQSTALRSMLMEVSPNTAARNRCVQGDGGMTASDASTAGRPSHSALTPTSNPGKSPTFEMSD